METQYITSFGLFYKNVWVLLGGCLTVKNQWELLTGDDGADLAMSVLNDHSCNASFSFPWGSLFNGLPKSFYSKSCITMELIL